jgi:hypothetical protein
VKIPYGPAYVEVAPVVQLYGVAMMFFSLTVVLMRYNLAIHDLKYVYLFAFFTFLEIGLLAVFHGSMVEMARVLLIINVVLFISSYGYVGRRIALLNKLYMVDKDEE